MCALVYLWSDKIFNQFRQVKINQNLKCLVNGCFCIHYYQ